MFADLLGMGVLGAIGMFILVMRLPRGLMLRLLGTPFILDVGFTALMFWMHWGTFSGVMVATFAGMMGSVAISMARRCIGYRDRSGYHKGWFDGRDEDDRRDKHVFE